MEEHQQVFLLIAEAATRGILYKNVFLKVLQIHRKTSVPEYLF